MGQVDVFAELKTDNPSVGDVQLRIYADALQAYCEASENVRRNGAVVSHPRTGTPIDNPCLKVQTSRAQILGKMRHVKASRVLGLLVDK
jgi:phage terminase small subunit